MLGRISLLIAHQVCTKNNNISRTFASIAATAGKEKWDLYAGILVERLPVVSKEFNEIEKEFQQYLWRVEFEKSLKSKHELQHEQEQLKLLKKGQADDEHDETVVTQTAQDLKDAYVDELNKFQFAPRATSDDNGKSLDSSNRCLDETLYLLLEDKLGSKSHLLLPQGLRKEGESMRQAADRILHEKCGQNMNVQFFGNAPCGFYKYKYPSTVRAQSVGAKIFFFRATLKCGNVDKTLNKKFEWLPKDVLTGKLNSAYSESVEKFLF